MDNADNDCPLSASVQRRNVIVYGINVGLVYVASPALYVGSIHAALLEKIGTTKSVANLPVSLYFWLSPAVILVSWYFCTVRVLVPVLVASYLLTALISGWVAAALLLTSFAPISGDSGADNMSWVTAAVILQGGAMGATLCTIANFQWEVLGRGVSSRLRGAALGLAFGVGPILAFAAALGSQAVLSQIEFPWNFAILFAITVPTIVAAAVLSSWFVLPTPEVDVVRQPFFEGVFGGIGEFLRYRLTLLAGIATLMVASGYNIITNFTLFTKEAVGEDAELYVGYQNALRFAFKAVAGLFLGWLLTRTNPKAGLLVTGWLCLTAVASILVAPGLLFLISFGLMGAGELWGVYFPNYILDSSPRDRMRRNMAIITLIYMLSGFAPYAFGLIADRYGLRASFIVAFVVLTATLVFVQVLLPARPRPPEA